MLKKLTIILLLSLFVVPSFAMQPMPAGGNTQPTTQPITPINSTQTEQHSIPDNLQLAAAPASEQPRQEYLPEFKIQEQRDISDLPSTQQPLKYRIKRVDDTFVCPFCLETSNASNIRLTTTTQLIQHAKRCRKTPQHKNWVLVGLPLQHDGRIVMVNWINWKLRYQCQICKIHRRKPYQFKSCARTCFSQTVGDTTNSLLVNANTEPIVELPLPLESIDPQLTEYSLNGQAQYPFYSAEQPALPPITPIDSTQYQPCTHDNQQPNEIISTAPAPAQHTIPEPGNASLPFECQMHEQRDISDLPFTQQPLEYRIKRVDDAFVCPFCLKTSNASNIRLTTTTQLVQHAKKCINQPQHKNWVLVGLPLQHDGRIVMVNWINWKLRYQCQICKLTEKFASEFKSCAYTCFSQTDGDTTNSSLVNGNTGPIIELPLPLESINPQPTEYSLNGRAHYPFYSAEQPALLPITPIDSTQHQPYTHDNQHPNEIIATAPAPAQHSIPELGNASLPFECQMHEQRDISDLPSTQQPLEYKIKKVDDAFMCPFCQKLNNKSGQKLTTTTQLIRHMKKCSNQPQHQNWVLTGLTIEKSGRTFVVDWYNQNSTYQCQVCKKYQARPAEFFRSLGHTCITRAAANTTNALGKEMAPIAQPAKLQHIEAAQHPTRGYFSQFQSELVPYEGIVMAELQRDAEAPHCDDEEQELQSSTATPTVSHKRSAHPSQLSEEQQRAAKKRKVGSLLQSQPIPAQAQNASQLLISMVTAFGNRNVPIQVQFDLATPLKKYWCGAADCRAIPPFNDMRLLTMHILNHSNPEPEPMGQSQFYNLYDYIKTMVKNVSKTCPNCNTVSYASFKQLREHWLQCPRPE